MNGITDQMEAALAYAVRNPDAWHFTDDERPAQPFIDLSKVGMIEMTTDWGQSLVVISSVTPVGMTHYQEVIAKRRRFAQISEAADELLGAIAANDEYKNNGRETALFEEEGSEDELYRELGQTGLLEILWADNKPYRYSMTDKGRSYIRGWFMEDLEKPVVYVNQYNNNTAQGGSSAADAVATNSNVLTLGLAIGKIAAMEIEDPTKAKAMHEIAELDEAAIEGDRGKFIDQLEKVVAIAKDSAALAGTILPFAAQLISRLFG